VFTRIARLFSVTAAGIAPIVLKPSPCSLDARSRFFLPRRGLFPRHIFQTAARTAGGKDACKLAR
jgi:hypothetical protein